MERTPAKLNRLVIVLGDQLNIDSPALSGLDAEHDCVWMAEVANESTHVWSSKIRICLFLSAMRHFRDSLRREGYNVLYHTLEQNKRDTIADTLYADLERYVPNSVRMVHAGDYRVQQEIKNAVKRAGHRLDTLTDTHFLCGPDEFSSWAKGRKQLRLEHFYRFMRRKFDVLMDDDGPHGGRWNFDRENRKSFAKDGAISLPKWPGYTPDVVTRKVIDLVNERFSKHPGSLSTFDWPVTRADAINALEDFLKYRLRDFGTYQDAMLSDQPFIYHSGLASAMNLKLLGPLEVIDAAIQAYRQRNLPLNSVEGFVRQVLGWREFVRGIYWRFMPAYLKHNYLDADLDLPALYWTGETRMECVKQVIDQTFTHGYAHHIQRLMVTGLLSLLLGVDPRKVHEWYLSVYVDAVEWVEVPNTIGMSQYADGGLLASKPYVASGRYIDRMSNYCSRCVYSPTQATGEKACPFTTLYWDFLQHHKRLFEKHPRTALQWRALSKLSARDKSKIKNQADRFREALY